MCPSSPTFGIFSCITYLLFYSLAIKSSKKIFLLHALPLCSQRTPRSVYHYASCIVLYLSFIYLTSQNWSYLKLRKVIIHLIIFSTYLNAWYTMGTVECCDYTQVNITGMQWPFLASNINKFASHQLRSVEKNGTRANHINHCYSLYLLISTLWVMKTRVIFPQKYTQIITQNAFGWRFRGYSCRPRLVYNGWYLFSWLPLN